MLFSKENCWFSAVIIIWRPMLLSRKLWILCKLQLRKSCIFCSLLFQGQISFSVEVHGIFAFMTLWEVKCFSAGNRGVSAVMTCEKSMSLGRLLWIFWFYDSLSSHMFLCRLSWIFCCYDLWEVNVSLQITVDFLILWLLCKSNVFWRKSWIFCFFFTYEESMYICR